MNHESLKRESRSSGELDMTPMVDVTFLLLIFFMVTASFSLQRSIVIPRQHSEASKRPPIDPPDQFESVEVQVDEFGSFLVMAPGWERESIGKQHLISSLREAAAGSIDGMLLAVTVHESAKLQSLVDCIDAGTIAGFAELRITQVDSFK